MIRPIFWSVVSDDPGVICVPWVSTIKKRKGIKYTIEGSKFFLANAFTQHQSQGGTFHRLVAVLNECFNKH